MNISNGTPLFFKNRLRERQTFFDISILPLNLSDGRNIGDLPGLFLYKAPQKAESSRLSDILILLFFSDNAQAGASETRKWADIISETYFNSRGSITSGINEAVKKLSAYLRKENKNKLSPSISMNAAVLRDRSVMFAHAGPVHSTIISADRVQNFSNEACLPIQLQQNELSFFSSDIHTEDIILLCPKVPVDWTNSAIMEVAGDSPLNAIRFLLDRSAGNLQAAVIQLRTGKGNITFRSKSAITANIQPENPDISEPAHSQVSNTEDSYKSQPSEEKPLMRQRKVADLFAEDKSQNTQEIKSDTESSDDRPDEAQSIEKEEEAEKETENNQPETKELPGSKDLPFDFSEIPISRQGNTSQTEEKNEKRNSRRKVKPPAVKPGKKEKFNLQRFFVILLCGLLIPVIVVSALFFIYSGRSKDQLHREYLSLGVAAAQKALSENDPVKKESLWTESLGYAEQSLTYGNSPAANDMRKEAMNQIDKINGGIATVYSYANQNKLPQGLIISEILASGQYTYALDTKSGSVLRFSASGNGLALDNNFTCNPGVYPDLNDKNSTIQVGPLVDFIILPSGNPHSFVLAGIDSGANILYCSGFSGNQAGKLKKTGSGKLDIKSITFSNNSMYILDTQASAVWEYLYNNSEGFIYEPSNYYGSYSPYLSDIIDFTMFKEYSFFLKEDGTLLTCDYTGYRPACSTITELISSDGNSHINLADHKFRKILVNNSPDNSIYIMDAKMQSVLNISAKSNFIRYIIPNRSLENMAQYSTATGFGINGQNRLIWAYDNVLYIGNMP